MKNHRGNFIIGILIIFLISNGIMQVKGQTPRYWSFGINAGPNIFIGDIKRFSYLPSTEDPSELKLAYGLTVDKKFTPVFGLRAQFLNGQLSGTDRELDRTFEAKVFEYNLSAVFNFNNLFSATNRTRRLELYGIVGLGFSNFETDQYLYSDQDTHLGGSGHGSGSGIGGRTLETTVPFGLELDYHLNRNWTLKGEYTLHPVYSDELDIREADFAYDMYNYVAVGISYKLHTGTQRRERPTPTEPEREEPTEEMITRQEGEPSGEETQPTQPEPEPAKPAPNVAINTQMAQQITNGKTFGMTLNVNKQHLRAGTEILQTFPSGFTPVETAGTTGNFKFEEQMLTLSWDELPEGKSFETSYNVKVENAIPGKYLIPGMMIYRYNNKSHSEKFRNYITVKRAAEQTRQETEPKPESTSPPALEYRVQIRAKKTGRLSKNELAKRFNLSTPIKEDIYNGYYIYTVGSFDTYEQARNYRDTLRRRHNVNDAFVVAFRYGERLDKLPEK
ncbi:MAG: porin family protein [Bacteroidales bacterium]|nr:porin family protein [Bacteroidales bacterium]